MGGSGSGFGFGFGFGWTLVGTEVWRYLRPGRGTDVGTGVVGPPGPSWGASQETYSGSRTAPKCRCSGGASNC
ncbi:hypothetical protein GCM10018785_46490 [Streptomyces longispororuber]|uniref:Uncharacterized protein n=1 Tax=Streptomyces longispororuber TaxID=68230 RepID=A0A918ZXG6_9ACTN|nr:hypothetical protein GCM10018785_46490 [Streptomyces longispororuber]